MTSTFTAADWRDVRLVAFDVDGTLYGQRPLRLRMGRDMVMHTMAKCDLSAINVVIAYRRIRERLAVEERADFAAEARVTPPERVKGCPGVDDALAFEVGRRQRPRADDEVRPLHVAPEK